SVAWCFASIWSAPEGSGLLTLEASSVQTAPDGYRRIVWMTKRMTKPWDAAPSVTQSTAATVGRAPNIPGSSHRSVGALRRLPLLHAVPCLRFRLLEGWFRRGGNGVRSARLWARLLGVEDAVIQRVWFDEQAEAVVVAARPHKHLQGRCGRCGRRCRGFDRGEGRRRWRALGVGRLKALVEADAPRVRCPEHGVVVAAVPWARHGAGHTRAFDDTTAGLGGQASKEGGGGVGRAGGVRRVRVAGGACPQAGRAGVAADRVGNGGPDRGAGGCRCCGGLRSVRGAAADRDRRDQLQEGPPLPHGRGGS